METSSISGLNDRANIFSTSKTRFGDNPFLKLLIAEMQAQTPLDPVNNSSFMEQMSQFSSMEQQQQLNDNLLSLLHFQGALARLNGLSQGSSMIGHEVEYVTDDKGTRKTGVVEAVEVDETGAVSVRIGGESWHLASIIGVRGAAEKSKNGSGNNSKS
ncbi:MAG: flagellar hook assembly protein FlgD [Planctomycetota bacterium]